MRLQVHVILQFSLILTSLCAENHDEDIFEPTEEWKTIKDGQAIPRGLHVRVNLATGKKEGKLLDKKESPSGTAILEVRSHEEDEPKIDDVKEALKHIKGEKVQETDKKQFRSFEELKKELAKSDTQPKTDTELLVELSEKFEQVFKTQKFSSQIAILEDLSYLVHQYDNALTFITLDGFYEIIYKGMNSTNEGVRRESVVLLGTAVQNHPKAQIYALESGALNAILRNLAMDQPDSVKRKAVFALFSCIRRFPVAQKRFLQNAGLSICEQVLEKSNDIKTHVKMVLFLADLLLEYQSALKLDTSDVDNFEKARQYRELDLVERLKRHNWCSILKKTFVNVLDIGTYDHDAIEKVLTAFGMSVELCKEEFDDKVQALIYELKLLYQKLGEQEQDGDPYFNDLSELCDNILNRLIVTASPIKLEL